MVSFFKWKRHLSYAMAAFVPIVLMTVALLVFKYNLMTSTIISFAGVIASIALGRSIGAHPWISALEGEGIWVIDIASPGFMFPTLCTLEGGKNIWVKSTQGWKRSLFNRAVSFYLKGPTTGTYKRQSDGKTIEIDPDKFTASNFAFMDQPVFLWNSKTGALLTKQALGEMETQIMTEHLSLLELEQQRDLSKDIHALNRTFFDTMRPSAFMDLIKNPLFIFFVIAVGGILILMFAGPQIQNFLGAGKAATTAVTGATKPLTTKASAAAIEVIKGAWF